MTLTFTVQVSIAINMGYIPEKFVIREYQSNQFVHNLG
jgi:hypothetical protein